MPPRQLLFRVQDILDSLEAIRSYITGMEYQDFVADRRTVDAVILDYDEEGDLVGLEILDASKKVPDYATLQFKVA